MRFEPTWTRIGCVQAWDPHLAEQTLANHEKHSEEAKKARERAMLASLVRNHGVRKLCLRLHNMTNRTT